MNRGRWFDRLPEIRARWSRAAEELGARVAHRPGSGRPMLTVPVEDSAVLLELVASDSGPITRASMPFHDPDRIVFGVVPEGVLTKLFKAFGWVQDIELGHRRFDDRFRVRGEPEERVREILADPVPDLLLGQPVSARLAVRPRWGSGMRLPSDIALVELGRSGEITDVASLQSMVDLVAEVGRRLDPVRELVGGDAVERRIARLLRGGGELVDRWTGATTWDLDPVRVRAAEELGESGDLRAVPALVSALSDDDDRVVVASLNSLQQLGSAAGLPDYVRLLARRKVSIGSRSIAELAGEALAEAGHGALASAFERALRGEPHALAVRIGEYRDEVVEALMEVAAGFDLDARIGAAQALGLLGAREALPLLRDSSFSMGVRTRFSEACKEAIRRIEAQASLPRAATSAPATDPESASDTLPRPAESAGGGTDTLPHPADEEG